MTSRVAKSCAVLWFLVTIWLGCRLLPAIAERVATGRSGHETWYADTTFNIHFDHHTTPAQRELGRGIRPRAILGLLRKSMPGAVQYHSKGHPGYATYPTVIGTPNPHLQCDVLRVWRDLTRNMGMKFTIYYSSGVDAVAAKEHPEWVRRKADGNPQNPCASSQPALCYNSDYPERVVLPMLREMIELYQPDGFWFDGDNWSVSPCWCASCRTAFKKETGTEPPTSRDDPLWPRFARFQRDSFVRYLEKCANLIHQEKPGCLFASNWAFTVRQPDPVPEFMDWLSGDVPPTHGPRWASFEARFLTTRGKPFDIMTWDNCYEWKPNVPPQLKTAVHLKQETAIIISNGGRYFLWDNPRPDGSLVAGNHEVIAEVGAFVRERAPWCHKTESVPYVAILHSESHHYAAGNGMFDYGANVHPIRGAHQALTEGHYHVDIINEETLVERVGEYRVLVIPEQTRLPQNVVAAVRNFVQNGGNLLATGDTAIIEGSNGGERFALSDVLGVELEGRAEGRYGFVPCESGQTAIHQPWFYVKKTAAQELFPLWDADTEQANTLSYPAVTENLFGEGRAIYVATRAFSEYTEKQYPRVRDLVLWCLDRLTPTKLLRTDAPRFVETSVRKKENMLIVNLINLNPGKDLSGSSYYVEEVPPVGPIAVEIECPRRPSKVTTEPGGNEPEWEWNRGRLRVTVPQLAIHCAIVIS